MTNLKRTVRADCAVSACSLLPPSIKALAHWLSVGGVSLWTGICPPLSPPSVAGFRSKANFPFHPPCLFIGFWAASSWTSFLAPNVRLSSHSRNIWLPRVFPNRAFVYDYTPSELLAHGEVTPRGGFWGMFLAAAETICFGDPPCFSPTRHWLSSYAFPWGNRNMHLDELTNSKTE